MVKVDIVRIVKNGLHNCLQHQDMICFNKLYQLLSNVLMFEMELGTPELKDKTLHYD